MIPIDRQHRYLIWAFWSLAAICLWNLNGVTALAFGMTRILSVMILGFGFVVLLNARESWVESLGRPGCWFFLMILVYLCLGAVLSFQGKLIVSHVNSLFVVLVAAVGTRFLAQVLGLARFMTVLAVFASLGALTVFLSPYLRPLYRSLETTQLLINAGRWMGFFANPNETGMAGVYALSCCLPLFSIAGVETRFRRFLPVLIGALALGVFLTFSRGAMIAFTGIGALYVLIAVRLSVRSFKLVLAAAIIAIGGYVFFTGGYKAVSWTPEQFKRIKSVERILTGGKKTDFDVGSRTSGIEAGLKYWSKAPVFGQGLGKLRKMPTIYAGGLGCHNTHVMFLGEVGIFGFSFYVLFWCSLLLTAYEQESRVVRQYCLMIGLTMMFNGMVGHTLLDNRNSNFLLGVVFGLLSLRYLEIEGHGDEKSNCLSEGIDTLPAYQ